MMDALKTIIAGALERLSQQIRTDLPPLLAAVTIFVAALLFARFARWLITRVFKGIQLDQWLRRSGLSSMISRSGNLRTSRLAAQTAYWAIVLAGAVAALNAFGTQVTVRMAEGVMMMLPRLVAAGAVVLLGLWLGQYAGRSALVWAVNEDLPSPRKMALAVRLLVVFAAMAIAADTVDFASGVFLAAFVLILGGAVLAAGLAIGLGSRESVRGYLAEKTQRAGGGDGDRLTEHSIWRHL